MARAAATRKKLPTDAYDFTNGVLTPWKGSNTINFERVGYQYTCDSDGVFRGKSDNVAAYSYHPLKGFENGLLVEEQASNLLPYSNDLSAISWSHTSVTTGSAVTNFDGATTAIPLTPNASSGQHYTNRDALLTSGNRYTMYIIAKSNGYQYLQVAPSTGFTSDYCNIDLDNAATTVNATPLAVVIKKINGWTHIWVTAAATSSVEGRFLFLSIATSGAARNLTWTPNGTSGCIIGHVSFGEYAIYGSPIVSGNMPNTTRYVPQVSIPVPSYVNSGDPFSLFINVAKKFASTLDKVGAPRLFELVNDVNNYYTVMLNQTTSNVQQNLVISGASQFGTDVSFSWSRDQVIKYMVTFDGTDTWKLYADSSLLRTDTYSGNPAFQTLELSTVTGIQYGNFSFRNVAFWNLCHSATDAQAITKYGY